VSIARTGALAGRSVSWRKPAGAFIGAELRIAQPGDPLDGSNSGRSKLIGMLFLVFIEGDFYHLKIEQANSLIETRIVRGRWK
jgi:hypothetical protein